MHLTEAMVAGCGVLFVGDISDLDSVDASANLRMLEAQQLQAAWAQRFGSTRGHRKELAAKYDVHVSYIGLLMNGHAPISSLWKMRLSQYLDIPAQEIWPDFDLHEAIAEQLPPHIADLLREAMKADPDKVRALHLLLKDSQSS